MLVDDIGFNFVSPTGIDESAGSEVIGIYPNPGSDYIAVNAGNVENVTYSIRNMKGQEVRQGVLISGKNTIQTDDFCSGIYSIEVRRNNSKKNILVS